MEKARIFNIERCATEDGPGIRTTVFLKGCNLRCKWCANPESQSFKPEILFKEIKCIGCGKCINSCPQQAIKNMPGYGMITDSDKCKLCGTCIDGCYADARVRQGTDYTVEELMEVLGRDEHYYLASGGGITVSGGEPLMYSKFIHACARKIRKRGWNILIETCGQVPQENIEMIAPDVDTIYCDYKHYDPEKHKELTGVDNRQIISNIRWIDEHFEGDFYLRYPYIPGCNDGTEAIEQFLKFAEQLSKVKEVVFLPYHRLGLPKYQGLGRMYGRYEITESPGFEFPERI